jgi:hypothetical protein
MKTDFEKYLDNSDLTLREILMVIQMKDWTMESQGTWVDGEEWYHVSVNKEIGNWIRATYADTRTKLWFDLGSPNDSVSIQRFDVHDSIYNMMLLTWPTKNT